MFTDMVGYTALGQRNESLSLALVEEQRNLIRPILKRHNGREIKTIGDAFLVIFPNALDAVRCAYDIQRATREFNVAVSEDKRIHLRIGVHLGDIIESGGDISGDAVNVASRIEPLAEDGGVCLTRQVYDHLKGKINIPMSGLGAKALKNVVEPVEVYRLVMPWAPDETVSSGELDKNRIAVLPFANMSPDPADEYFADGMTEELISTVSRIEGLKVIARTSVMSYKGERKRIPEIAKELEVGTILEGSVRKSGNKLRITAQLIDARTSNHLWAESYDREMSDVFAIQTEVASKVARALSMDVFSGSHSQARVDVEAYAMYLKALQSYHESTESGLRNAISLLELALSKDPAFVRAYAGLAAAWGRMAQGGYEEFTIALNRAETAARKAVEIGPDWAESHEAVAIVKWYQDNGEAAIAEAERAVQINPNLSESYYAIGMSYATRAQLDYGAQFLRKAYELDPLSLSIVHGFALVLALAGEESEAFAVWNRLLQFSQDNPRVYDGLAEFYMLHRDFAKAQEMLSTGLRINPTEYRLRLNQGVLFALTNRRELALGQLENIMQEKSESPRLYGQMYIHAALGENDEALDALMKGAEQFVWPALILSLPVFEGVRKDPRFTEFCVIKHLPIPS